MHVITHSHSARDEVRPQDHGPLMDAALEAEQGTGEHELTLDRARPHLLVRLGRICGGLCVLLVGVTLLVLPGPGLALIIAGLSILAVDIPFARRLRNSLLERSDRATRFVPKRLKKWLLVAGTVIGIGVSCLLVVR